MYPNNLLNGFLYGLNNEKFPSPLCKCGEEIQTVKHILFQCNLVEDTLKAEAYNLLVQTVGEAEAAMDSTVTLLNASRDEKFMDKLIQIIQSQLENLHTSIEI